MAISRRLRDDDVENQYLVDLVCYIAYWVGFQ